MRRPRRADAGGHTRRPWVAPLIVVHRDVDRSREHVTALTGGACWCDPELVSCHTEARA